MTFEEQVAACRAFLASRRAETPTSGNDDIAGGMRRDDLGETYYFEDDEGVTWAVPGTALAIALGDVNSEDRRMDAFLNGRGPKRGRPLHSPLG